MLAAFKVSKYIQIADVNGTSVAAHTLGVNNTGKHGNGHTHKRTHTPVHTHAHAYTQTHHARACARAHTHTHTHARARAHTTKKTTPKTIADWLLDIFFFRLCI